MLEEILLLYTFYGMNVCAEPHLSECRNRQTDGSTRRSIALRAANGKHRGANRPFAPRVTGNRSSHLSEHSMQLPNSISKDTGSEAFQTHMSEQCSPFSGGGSSRKQLLSGWKEIATYMHQGVRTVQRWELIGLPIRRVRNKGRSPVIAFAEDLDVWARSLHVPLLDRIEELRATISSLEAQICSLKCQLRVRNRPAHVDRTPSPHAITHLSQNCASGSLPRSGANNSSRPALMDSDGSE